MENKSKAQSKITKATAIEKLKTMSGMSQRAVCDPKTISADLSIKIAEDAARYNAKNKSTVKSKRFLRKAVEAKSLIAH